VARACEYVRCLDADGRAPFYLVSIIADNDAANRLFSAGLPGLPRLEAYARYRTYAIHLGRLKAELQLPAGLRLERSSEARVPALLACLRRNGVRRQFAPVWTEDILFSPAYTPGLAPHDFVLALDGDRIVGCLAGWDQGRFKQTIVRGYGGQLRRWRPVINAAARLGGWAPLPAPGRPMRHLYASHLAVDGDDPAVFAALLRALYNHAAERGYEYLMLGLAEANPLCGAVTRAYRQTTYTSQLYLATWDDGCEAIAQVDGRVPGPEIAVL
jgi:hypothetical protein